MDNQEFSQLLVLLSSHAQAHILGNGEHYNLIKFKETNEPDSNYAYLLNTPTEEKRLCIINSKFNIEYSNTELPIEKVFPVFPAEHEFVENIPNTNYRVRYYLHDDLVKHLRQESMTHIVAVMQDVSSSISNAVFQDAVCLFAFDTYLILLVKRSTGTEFIGASKYETPEEFLFHVLQVYKLHDLDVSHFPLIIYGGINQNTKIFSLLSNMIQNIHFKPALTFESSSRADLNYTSLKGL